MSMIDLPKAVFFDWDGTLVDSFAFLHAAHNHARTSLGMEPFSLKDFEGYFGQPREILYTKIYGEHRDKAKAYFEEFVFNHYAEHLKPLDGAKEVLDWFKGAGIPMGVVSNKKRELIEAEIVNYGWDDYFIALVGAAEASSDKPSPAPLALAVERGGLDVSPEEVWYVGDTENDLGCGNDFGAVCVFIESDDMYKNLSKIFKIDVHSRNCRRFLDFLLQYDEKALKTSC
jgi:phosphoglycolate phosphatase